MASNPHNQVVEELNDAILAAAKADGSARSAPDAKERAEREAAARAYAGENEQHFVDYLTDCVQTSRNARREIRRVQDECWRVYKEKEPGSYANKAPWQARIVVPKPFSTIQFGAASVMKAFTPDYLKVTDAADQRAAEFWQEVLKVQLGPGHANFEIAFTDATTMALAVGESLDMIPQFVPGHGDEGRC